MKVLLWNSNFWPAIGGLEVITGVLARSLAQNHTVEILAPTPGPEMYYGMKVHRVPFTHESHYTSPSSLKQLCLMVAGIKEDFSPDIVHLNGVSAHLSLHLLTRKATPAPTLLTLHGPWSDNAKTLALSALSVVDKLAVCSQYTFDFVRANQPQIGEKLHLIRNALPAPPSSPQPLPEDPVFLILGRLSPEKGFDLAVRAFSQLAPEFPKLRLLIGGDGRERSSLESLVEDHRLSSRVEFLGEVKQADTPALYARASLVLVPSRTEGFGLTALEAAWFGRPVVATEVGGLPEVVQDGVTGYLVKSDDPEALASACRKLLSRPDKLFEMATNARQEVASRFNWDEHVREYSELYERLLR